MSVSSPNQLPPVNEQSKGDAGTHGHTYLYNRYGPIKFPFVQDITPELHVPP